MAGVRNAQLDLTKEQVKLQEGELELSHQLAFAVRDLETNYVLTQTAFNRRKAAEDQLQDGRGAVPGRHSGDRRGHPDPQRPLAGPAGVLAGRKRLLSGGGQLQQVDRRRYTTARVRCWSIMAYTWPRGRGLARRTSTPAAAPVPARLRRTSTTASRSRRSSAAGRSSRTRAARMQDGELFKGGELFQSGGGNKQGEPTAAPPKPEPIPAPSRDVPAEPGSPGPMPEPKPEPMTRRSPPPGRSGDDRRRQHGLSPRRANVGSRAGETSAKRELRRSRRCERLEAAGEPVEGCASGRPTGVACRLERCGKRQ